MIEKERIKKIEEVTLSASKINLYYECPRKYLYRYLYTFDKPIISTSWPASGLGDSVHKVIEWANKTKKEGVDDKSIFNNAPLEFKKVYDNWLIKNKTTFKKSKGYNYETFTKNGMKYSSTIVKFLFSYFDDYIDVLPEFEFDITYEFCDNVKLKGIIDIMYFFEDSYKIIDFKTTKDSNKFYFIDWSIDTQSLMYLYYGMQQYEKLPESFSYMVFNHEQKTLFFKETFLENKKNIFKGLTYQLEDVRDFTLKPNLSLANPAQQKCYWCEYKDECEKQYKTSLKAMLGKIK